MIQRPLQCASIFNFFLFPGLLNPFYSFVFWFFSTCSLLVFLSVLSSLVPYSLTSVSEMRSLNSLLCYLHFDSCISSFTYRLRDFCLSDLGLCGCQGTHLLSSLPSILIVCRLPNTAFVLSNALQKLFCIIILLSLVYLQFLFCKFDSSSSLVLVL